MDFTADVIFVLYGVHLVYQISPDLCPRKLPEAYVPDKVWSKYIWIPQIQIRMISKLYQCHLNHQYGSKNQRLISVIWIYVKIFVQIVAIVIE